MHIVEGVPKKELARRFCLNIKTVRRHLEDHDYRGRKPPKRRRSLDNHRAEIEALLKDDAKLSAKRVGRVPESRSWLHASLFFRLLYRD